MSPELLKKISDVYHGKAEPAGTPADIVVIAKGVLGKQLIEKPNFAGLGVKIVAIFAEVEEASEGMYKVFPIDKMSNLLPRLDVDTALLCVPHREAEDAVRQLSKDGVVNIWNWSGTELPPKRGVAILNDTVEWTD